jgi:hypothetical protein
MATRIIGYLVDDVNPPRPITEQMATPRKNPWKAMIVFSSEHAGLFRPFALLEDDMLGTLAQLDDARQVRDYLTALREASDKWLIEHQRQRACGGAPR